MKKLLLIGLIIIFPLSADGVDFLKVVKSSANSRSGGEFDEICDFYDLTYEEIVLTSESRYSAVVGKLSTGRYDALYIDDAALDNMLVKVLRLVSDVMPIPIFIADLDTNQSAYLSRLTNGTVTVLHQEIAPEQRVNYAIGNFPDLTHQVSDQILRLFTNNMFHFHEANPQELSVLVNISGPGLSGLYPHFVIYHFGKTEMYLETELSLAYEGKPTYLKKQQVLFAETAPLMMFCKKVIGDRMWHIQKPMANLTIDDPWLTSVYGSLNYQALLAEMDKANFHTTIAYIPWNYDKWEATVVDMFKRRPDRFSLAIHGNNHDHYEFWVESDSGTLAQTVEYVPDHELKIQQAIARMDKFSTQTDLVYEQVMIFPHSIAPAPTLRLLKQYNFLATVNRRNIPLGEQTPHGSVNWRTVVSMEYSNFPSVRRFRADAVDRMDVAINLFLGNPILLYGHVAAYDNLFAEGPASFNQIADIVNTIEPQVQWMAVGRITRHLYYTRRRNSYTWDVKFCTREIQLENPTDRERNYRLYKPEDFHTPIRAFTVDGQSWRYREKNGELVTSITVPPRESRLVSIVYQNDVRPGEVDVAKDNLHVNLIRRLSDFRDNTMMSFSFGKSFIKFYYESGLFKMGMKIFYGLFGLFVLLVVTYIYRKVQRSSLRHEPRHTQKQNAHQNL